MITDRIQNIIVNETTNQKISQLFNQFFEIDINVRFTNATIYTYDKRFVASYNIKLAKKVSDYF